MSATTLEQASLDRTLNFHSQSAASISSSAANTAVRCDELKGLSNTTQNASPALQSCLDRAHNGVVIIPAGVFRLENRIRIVGPIAIVSDNLSADGSVVKCGNMDARCAHFLAANDVDFSAQGSNWMGVFDIQGANITIQSIILDGNKRNRPRTGATSACSGGNGAAGQLVTLNATSVNVLGSVFENAVCGSGFDAFVVNGGSFENNTFQSNGTHDQSNMWSDGFTLGEGNHVQVTGNTFIDNTDVQFVMGGCQDCLISGNTFRHSGDPALAAFSELHVQNWPATSGNFTNTHVTGNDIDCRYQCGMGLAFGARAWGPLSGAGSYGAIATGNIISRALIAINVDAIVGQTIIEGNTIGIAAVGAMACAETNNMAIAVTAINVSPDSLAHLAPSSRAALTAFINKSDSRLVTQKAYPNCVPGVSSARIDASFDLSVASTRVTDPVVTVPVTATVVDPRVTELYGQVLDRVPDQAGGEFYTARLAAGASLLEIQQALAYSAEATRILSSYYTGYLHYTDPVGLAYWQGQLAAGVPLASIRQEFIKLQ